MPGPDAAAPPRLRLWQVAGGGLVPDPVLDVDAYDELNRCYGGTVAGGWN